MCPLTVDYSWGYTMPCKKHYSYTWTKGYGSDRLNAGGDEDGRQGNTSFRYQLLLCFDWTSASSWACMKAIGSRRWPGGKTWDCLNSRLYCQEVRCENRNGTLAGKAGLSWHNVCFTKNGLISSILKNGTWDICRIYGQTGTIWDWWVLAWCDREQLP